MPPARPAITLSALYVYPVKSLRGIALDSAEVDARGIRHDRRFMVVDARGRFLTQRELPRMARVAVRLEAPHLLLDADGQATLRVPLEPRARDRWRVRVWSSRVEAVPVGPEADRWLSRALGTHCHLVHMPQGARRLADPRYARGRQLVSFADAFPFLLASAASLEDLNRRLQTPVVMRRFRPNLVVRGAPPFAEDGWREIAIGSLSFRVVKPCSRCAVTTVDPDTGERGTEPLRTLAAYRKRAGKVYFAQNLVHAGPGELRVGDAVVVRRGE
jgi:hypothetical protein